MSTEELSTSDSEAAFAGAGERWTPVGAVASPEDERGNENIARPKQRGSSSASEEEMAARMRKLEEEQDLLNSSLLALTSHFAQVQFRLKQIVHAQTEEKEGMLIELEEFAFKGCPHVVGCRTQDANQLENSVSFDGYLNLLMDGRVSLQGTKHGYWRSFTIIPILTHTYGLSISMSNKILQLNSIQSSKIFP